MGISDNKKKTLCLIAIMCALVVLIAPILGCVIVSVDLIDEGEELTEDYVVLYSGYETVNDMFENYLNDNDIFGDNELSALRAVVVCMALISVASILLCIKPMCSSGDKYKKYTAISLVVSIILAGCYCWSTLDLFLYQVNIDIDEFIMCYYCGFIPVVINAVLAIVYLCVRLKMKDKAIAVAEPLNAQPKQEVAINSMANKMELLSQYHSMLKEGIITQEDYDQLKSTLI